MRVVYASRALREIDEILAYVQSRSPRGADKVSRAIERAIEFAALNPLAGESTEESGLFRHPLARYPRTVFCRVDADRPRGSWCAVEEPRSPAGRGQIDRSLSSPRILLRLEVWTKP